MNTIASFPAPSRRHRYSAEERESIVQQARHMRAEGMKMAAVVSELGVSGMTLAKWLKESRPAPAFLPVQVIPDSAAVALTLVTPAGYRVEGLSPEALVTLLRQLG